MNTQETLEALVKRFEDKIRTEGIENRLDTQVISAYCLAVIARSLTR